MFDNLFFQIAIVCIILAIIKAIYVTNNSKSNEIIKIDLPSDKVKIPEKVIALEKVNIHKPIPVPMIQQTNTYLDSDSPLLYGSDEIIESPLNFDDAFLYTDDSYVVDHTVHRMHEAIPGNPMLKEDGRTIGEVHDDYHFQQVSRLDEDGDVDGIHKDLYDINGGGVTGYTGFQTY